MTYREIEEEIVVNIFEIGNKDFETEISFDLESNRIIDIYIKKE